MMVPPLAALIVPLNEPVVCANSAPGINSVAATSAMARTTREGGKANGISEVSNEVGSWPVGWVDARPATESILDEITSTCGIRSPTEFMNYSLSTALNQPGASAYRLSVA